MLHQMSFWVVVVALPLVPNETYTQQGQRTIQRKLTPSPIQYVDTRRQVTETNIITQKTRKSSFQDKEAAGLIPQWGRRNRSNLTFSPVRKSQSQSRHSVHTIQVISRQNQGIISHALFPDLLCLVLWKTARTTTK